MILKIGSNGSAVAQLQLTLNFLAHARKFDLPGEKLKGTGTFGVNTEAVVKAFQKQHKLEVDGVVGPITFEKIDELRAAIAASQLPPVDQESKDFVIQKLLQIARVEVGVREVGGNNCGVRVRDYQRATDLRPLGPWPWCAAFTCWVLNEWLNKYPEAVRALGWKNEEIEARRPKTAGAFDYINWARRFDQEVLPPTVAPEPGMIAVFDFSHIGFVVARIGEKKIRTIEGNTNGRGDRDSVSGDGVWEKERAISLVRNFIRLRLVASPAPGIFVSNSKVSNHELPNVRGIGDIPREALEFIIDEEGMDQPWKFPGGDSGVTLGHGYDLGAGTESKTEMIQDWKAWISGEQLDRLASAIGKTGDAASAICNRFRDINISIEAADDVFYRATVPKYYEKMISAFPNADKLPGLAQGALLSLVFNRGTSMKGERREEMREIRDLLSGSPPFNLKAIAASIRDMKKLWEGKGLGGLIARREREARMVEAAVA
jgi:GH24 family phage-related lysozyme (muramidase)